MSDSFWLAMETRVRGLLRSYASMFDGVVEEVGSGANEGMVRVRRPAEDVAVADLPWAKVYGSTPAVGAVVFTLVSFTGGRRVITGGGGGTVSDASTTTKGISKLSVAPATATDPIAAGTNDPRMTDARAPTAHATTHQPGGTDAMAVDAVAATGSLRTLGTGAQQAAAGSHVNSRDGHPLATSTLDGFIAAADKAKLDALSSQAVGFFSAYKSTDQLDIANNTNVKVTFETEEFDVSGWYDPATSRYTPQKAGYYQFWSCLAIGPCVDQKLFAGKLFKNGAQLKYFLQIHTSGTSTLIASGTAAGYANGTTDYFEIYTAHTFGVATSDLFANSAYAWVQGVYLGA